MTTKSKIIPPNTSQDIELSSEAWYIKSSAETWHKDDLAARPPSVVRGILTVSALGVRMTRQDDPSKLLFAFPYEAIKKVSISSGYFKFKSNSATYHIALYDIADIGNKAARGSGRSDFGLLQPKNFNEVVHATEIISSFSKASEQVKDILEHHGVRVRVTTTDKLMKVTIFGFPAFLIVGLCISIAVISCITIAIVILTEN